MSLQDLIAQIDKNRAYASVDLDLIPSNTRPAHEMAARDAAEKLPQLETQYRDELLAASTAQFNETRGADFVVDAREPFAYLARRVEETMGPSREFSGEQAVALLMAAHDYLKPFGIKVTDVPLSEVRICPTHDDVVAYVRLLFSNMGIESAVAAGFVVKTAGEMALAAKESSKATIAVVNATPSVIAALTPHFASVSVAPAASGDESFVVKGSEQPISTKGKGRSNKTK